MPTTTEYGTWNNRIHSYSLSLENEISDALAGEYTDAETEAIIEAYRDAINAALPDSVALCGDIFYGNAYPQDCNDQENYPHDEDGSLDIAAIVESVDFWEIVDRVTNDGAGPQ
jgi:hypothetical protein